MGLSATTMQTMASNTEQASASVQPQGSASASATISESTGGAVLNRVAGCGVALTVLGMGFSLL